MGTITSSAHDRRDRAMLRRWDALVRSTHRDVERAGTAAVAVIADDLAVARDFDGDCAVAVGLFDHAFQTGAAHFVMLRNHAVERYVHVAIGCPERAVAGESQPVGAGDCQYEVMRLCIPGRRRRHGNLHREQECPYCGRNHNPGFSSHGRLPVLHTPQETSTNRVNEIETLFFAARWPRQREQYYKYFRWLQSAARRLAWSG